MYTQITMVCMQSRTPHLAAHTYTHTACTCTRGPLVFNKNTLTYRTILTSFPRTYLWEFLRVYSFQMRLKVSWKLPIDFNATNSAQLTSLYRDLANTLVLTSIKKEVLPHWTLTGPSSAEGSRCWRWSNWRTGSGGSRARGSIHARALLHALSTAARALVVLYQSCACALINHY